MKILERGNTENGTPIQLEDWDGNLQIGAYPVARNTSKFGWIKSGDVFRLSISASNYNGYSNEMVKSDFEALKHGKKVLEDLKMRYWDGEKDQFYMGLIDVEPSY